MKNSILPRRDGKVKVDFVCEVQSMPMFSHWKGNEELLKKFLEGAEIVTKGPQVPVWKADDDVGLSIVLDGLLAVNYEKNVQGGIDSFIVKGQLIGDFEFLSVKSRKTSITTLTSNVKILKLKAESVAALKNDHPALTFGTAGISVGSKFDHKSGIITLVKKNEVIDRLKYLFSELRHNKDWSSLFKDSGDGYTFEVLWSDDNLISLLSTDFHSIRRRLSALVQSRIISVDLYGNRDAGKASKNDQEKRSVRKTRTIGRLRTLNPDELLKRDLGPKTYYLKIKVLDETALMEFEYRKSGEATAASESGDGSVKKISKSKNGRQ